MHIVKFYHSLLSDWNYGNAHFLRGVVSELLVRGHQVAVYEPTPLLEPRKLNTRVSAASCQVRAPRANSAPRARGLA